MGVKLACFSLSDLLVVVVCSSRPVFLPSPPSWVPWGANLCGTTSTFFVLWLSEGTSRLGGEDCVGWDVCSPNLLGQVAHSFSLFSRGSGSACLPLLFHRLPSLPTPGDCAVPAGLSDCTSVHSASIQLSQLLTCDDNGVSHGDLTGDFSL